MSKNFQRGYTLIEIMVAVGIFFVVIAAPTGFFVSSLKGQQKALSSQQLVDNISYTLEYMSRAIRMAKKDTIGDCVILEGSNYRNYEKTFSRNLEGVVYSGPGIRFKDYQDPSSCREFFLDENDNRLKEVRGEFSAPIPLTPNNVEVLSFKLSSDNSWDQNDNEQPRVTLFLEVKGVRSQRPELQPVIKIQTTISQRNLDVQY